MSKELGCQMILNEESAFLDISVPYGNDTDAEKHLSLEYKLTLKGRTVAEFKKEVLAIPNNDTVFHIPLSVYHPELFTPESPSVYSLTVNVVSDGQCEEKYGKQITFKQYELEQDVCMLNGKAFFPKAMVIHPIVKKTGDSPFTNNMYHRAVYNAKKYGFNTIVVEEATNFITELGERFGLLVLEADKLPKSTVVYAEKSVGADAPAKLQVEQTIRLCEAYHNALRNVTCGAFAVADYAVFDEFSRPTVAANAMKAIWNADKDVYACKCENEVFAFTSADTCKGYVNAHPVGELKEVAEGVFVGELPETYIQYSVVTNTDAQAIIRKSQKAVKIVFTAETSKRNIDCDTKDMVPVTVYAVDANGTIDANYEGDAHFVPYSSAIIRGETDFTQDVGIGSDKYGNVVRTEGGSDKEQEKYILPFKGGMATVLLSARSNSRFTGITVFTEFGSKTAYLDY